MPDSKAKKDQGDRSKVAGDQSYERHFANKHGISREQAQKLINQVGNDRQKLDGERSGKPMRNP